MAATVPRNCNTDTIPSQLPTPAELKEAEEALLDTQDTLGRLGWQVARIARGVQDDEAILPLVEGDQRPTWEDIGRLHMFVRDAEDHVEEMKHNIDRLKRELDDLALFVRYEERGVFERQRKRLTA